MFRQTLPATTMMLSLLLPGTAWPTGEQNDPHACSFKVWLGKTAEFEKMLAEAEVTASKEIGVGVMDPVEVTLEDQGRTVHAAFKPIKRGRHRGFWESYQAEIVAYELDKMFGMDMVPPTRAREINGRKGAIQLWVEGCKTYGDMEDDLPRSLAWNRDLSRMKMFDLLIHNADRNAGNILIDPHDHIILIDHSRAFVSSTDMLKDKGRFPVAFDRKLVEKLKTLEVEDLKSRFGDLLLGDQIDALIKRRDAILEHLDELIKERGEAAVLFN